MLTTLLRAAILTGLALPSGTFAQGPAEPIAWTTFVDPLYNFSVELPMGLFEPLGSAGDIGLTLAEIGGGGQLSLYGGPVEGLTIEDFAARLAAGEQIRTITYRAGGQSWFVLSGHYEKDGQSGDPLIFYTKVLVSADGQSFSAFEISYPTRDKERYDPIVSRIEDSLTRPGSAN